MPTRYLSTFQTGFEDIVESVLSKRLKDITIELILDGLIVYRSSATVNEVRQLRFLNNTFILLRSIKNLGRNSLRTVAVDALKSHDIGSQFMASMPHKSTSFRVMAVKENQPEAIDRALLSQLENHIRQTSSYLHLHRSKPQIEFWCLARREGYGFFAMRVTTNPNYEKTLAKGELRPELAHLLCLLSNPHANDVFLDPFSGSGAIPFERSLMLPASRIIAGECNRELVQKLYRRLSSVKRSVAIMQLDALHLPFENASITRIVTDPPWGFYEKDFDLPRFYIEMMVEFNRILKPNGVLVLLTSQTSFVDSLLKQFMRLRLLTIHSTLVSGQKASVYQLRKSN